MFSEFFREDVFKIDLIGFSTLISVEKEKQCQRVSFQNKPHIVKGSTAGVA